MNINLPEVAPYGMAPPNPKSTLGQVQRKQLIEIIPVEQTEYTPQASNLIRFNISNPTDFISWYESYFRMDITRLDDYPDGSVQFDVGGINCLIKSVEVRSLERNDLIHRQEYYNKVQAFQSVLHGDPLTMESTEFLQGDCVGDGYVTQVQSTNRLDDNFWGSVVETTTFKGEEDGANFKCLGFNNIYQYVDRGDKLNLVLYKAYEVDAVTWVPGANSTINPTLEVTYADVANVTSRMQHYTPVLLKGSGGAATNGVWYRGKIGNVSSAAANPATYELIRYFSSGNATYALEGADGTYIASNQAATFSECYIVSGDNNDMVQMTFRISNSESPSTATSNNQIVAPLEEWYNPQFGSLASRNQSDVNQSTNGGFRGPWIVYSGEYENTFQSPNPRKLPLYSSGTPVRVLWKPATSFFKDMHPLFIYNQGIQVILELEYGDRCLISKRPIALSTSAFNYKISNPRFMAKLLTPSSEIYTDYMARAASGIIFPCPMVRVRRWTGQASVQDDMIQQQFGVVSARRVYVVIQDSVFSEGGSAITRATSSLTTYLRTAITQFQFKVGSDLFPLREVLVDELGFEALEQLRQCANTSYTRFRESEWYATNTIPTATGVKAHESKFFIMCADLSKDDGPNSDLQGINLHNASLDLEIRRSASYNVADPDSLPGAPIYWFFVEYDSYIEVFPDGMVKIYS